MVVDAYYMQGIFEQRPIQQQVGLEKGFIHLKLCEETNDTYAEELNKTKEEKRTIKDSTETLDVKDTNDTTAEDLSKTREEKGNTEDSIETLEVKDTDGMQAKNLSRERDVDGVNETGNAISSIVFDDATGINYLCINNLLAPLATVLDQSALRKAFDAGKSSCVQAIERVKELANDSKDAVYGNSAYSQRQAIMYGFDKLSMIEHMTGLNMYGNAQSTIKLG